MGRKETAFLIYAFLSFMWMCGVALYGLFFYPPYPPGSGNLLIYSLINLSIVALIAIIFLIKGFYDAMEDAARTYQELDEKRKKQVKNFLGNVARAIFSMLKKRNLKDS